MHKRMVVAASVAVALAMTSCGSDSSGATTADFSDQLASVCRVIGRGIGNLDDATSIDDVRANASNASALYEDGINELKKLKIPTNDKDFAADATDLIASFEDQLDTLDAIARAAKSKDQEAVDTNISTLTDQAAGSNDLADNLDVARCQLEPVFAPAPVTTEPNVPLTLPIATLPPGTVPPETVPFDTAPPDTNKTVVSSSDLVPLGDYTFADAPVDATNGFQQLLDLSPTMSPSQGGSPASTSSARMGCRWVGCSSSNPTSRR